MTDAIIFSVEAIGIFMVAGSLAIDINPTFEDGGYVVHWMLIVAGVGLMLGGFLWKSIDYLYSI